MDGIVIRPATMDDYKGVRELFSLSDQFHAKAIPDYFIVTKESPRSREYLSFAVKSRSQEVLIAQDGNTIAGMLQILIKTDEESPISPERTVGYIVDFFVRDEYRRKGVGRLLVNAVHDWLRKKGVTECELHVWEFNKTAIAFYDDMGYETINRMLRIKL